MTREFPWAPARYVPAADCISMGWMPTDAMCLSSAGACLGATKCPFDKSAASQAIAEWSPQKYVAISEFPNSRLAGGIGAAGSSIRDPTVSNLHMHIFHASIYRSTVCIPAYSAHRLGNPSILPSIYAYIAGSLLDFDVTRHLPIMLESERSRAHEQQSI